jgi:hypothetical protein
MKFQTTEKQISPCIVSKAKYALGLKQSIPNQKKDKKCSRVYWSNTIEAICIANDINDTARKSIAIDLFETLIK